MNIAEMFFNSSNVDDDDDIVQQILCVNIDIGKMIACAGNNMWMHHCVF